MQKGAKKRAKTNGTSHYQGRIYSDGSPLTANSVCPCSVWDIVESMWPKGSVQQRRTRNSSFSIYICLTLQPEANTQRESLSQLFSFGRWERHCRNCRWTDVCGSKVGSNI